MGKIRINDLARELEVKSKAIVEFLPEIGVTDKRSHSSALDEEHADRVRAHFRGLSEPGGAPPVEAKKAPAAAPKAAPIAAAPTPEEPAVAHPVHVEPSKAPEVRPMTRTIAEIKAEARKAMMGPRAVAPAVTPAKPLASGPVAPPVSTARRTIPATVPPKVRTAAPV